MSTFRWVAGGLLGVLALGLVSLIGVAFRYLQHLHYRQEKQDDHHKSLQRDVGRIEGILGIKNGRNREE